MPTTHPIAAVARMTGLSVDTLRAWERRYGLVAPRRDGGGVRRYSERDLARLELARAATALGHPIRAVAKLSNDELQRLVGSGSDAESIDPPAEPMVGAVLAFLERYDLDQAERALNARALLMPAEAFVMDVLVPLMQEVGRRWEAGRLSIAQEHIISYLVRNLVGRLARLRAVDGPCAMVFATPPGEPHEFGIALAACLASMHGLRPCVLGPNLPAGEVVAASRHLRPRTVVIGVTLCVEPDACAYYVRALNTTLPRRTEIWVGGEGAKDRREWPPRAHHIASLRDFARRIAKRGSYGDVASLSR